MDLSAARTAAPRGAYPVDVEHAGIRLALPAIIVLGGVVLYVGLTPLIGAAVSAALGEDTVSGFITLAAAISGALTIGAVADRLLKSVWHSGRSLAIDTTCTPHRLILRDARRGKTAQTELTLDAALRIMAWRFTIRRSSPRAPSGWHMLAVQLGADDGEVILYAFLSPKALAALPEAGAFHPLIESAQPPRSERAAKKSRLSIRETAEQRRYLAAEAQRWQDGAELLPADFAEVLGVLAAHVPGLAR